MRFAVVSLSLAIMAAAPQIAVAQSPEPGEPELTPIEAREDIVALMASYDGNWVARGTSRLNFSDPLEATSCRMTSVFEAAADTLMNEGRCSNVQRAIDLDGDLAISPEGDITGAFFSRFEVAELLASEGQAYEEGFIIDATYLADVRGESEEFDVRVSVSRPQTDAGGDDAFSMVIQIRNPDDGEYMVFTELVFTERAG